MNGKDQLNYNADDGKPLNSPEVYLNAGEVFGVNGAASLELPILNELASDIEVRIKQVQRSIKDSAEMFHYDVTAKHVHKLNTLIWTRNLIANKIDKAKTSESSDSIEEQMAKMYRKHRQHIDKFAEEQFVVCMLEAIKSGDFMHHVNQDETLHGFSYIPHREKYALQQENRKLREAVNKFASHSSACCHYTHESEVSCDCGLEELTS